MGNNLKGKVAAVTGSGQGIGRAIAMALAKEGAKVVTNNRKPNSTDISVLLGDYNLDTLSKEQREEVLKRCEELGGDAATTAEIIKKLGGEAMPFFGDVAKFDVASKFIQTTVDKYGKIDILVNNAGTFRYGACWEMPEEVWDVVAGAKPKSSFNTVRHAAPYMIKQKWGRIINCSSVSWLGVQPDHSNYCAANAGVVGYTMAIARELYPFGITCNVYVPTALTRATATGAARFKRMADDGKDIPKERLMMYERTPVADELGPFIAFLATDAAANITGSVFRVAGNHVGLYSVPEETSTIEKKEGMWTVDELMNLAPQQLLKAYKNFAGKPF
jgi:3-oxoacyl-[acyl-carrier protein] reductase